MDDSPWVFGELPFDEQREMATLLRDVGGYMLALEQPTPAVRDLVAKLRAARDYLQATVPADQRPRTGDHKDSDGRVYLDHSRSIGEFNACFPVYDLTCVDDRAEGWVEFPIIYEGPPGIVHGGMLATLFDCVLQQLNCDLGLAGKTVSIEVHYKRPTPLNTRLRIEASREVAGDRIHSRARLFNGEKLVCEAQMSAVAGRRENLPAVSPRHAP